MWNQWSAGPPPIPAPSAPAPQQPLIGPVLPTGPVPSNPAPPPTAAPTVVQQPSYPASSGAPTYTPAQYAAMTPEQQYAVQQHWQQWQAYEQQYAQWHAQYGEQYKREMAAIHGAPPAAAYGNAVPQLPPTNSYAYPPPAAANPYQAPPAAVQAPPPPPPDDSQTAMGVKAPPQIYDQPPPPPPPPQTEDSQQNNSRPPLSYQSGSAPQGPTAQYTQQPDNRWSQPPPSMQNQAGRWNDSGSTSCPMIGSVGGQQGSQMGGPMGVPMVGPMGGQMVGQTSGSMGNQQQFNNNNNNNQQGNQNQQNEKGRNRRGGRGRGRSGNNFENNNRQQEFDDSNGRNNRQQQFNDSNGRNNRQQQFEDSDGRNNRQSWGQSDNYTQGNNRGNFNNNRIDNYDHFNRNMGQNNGHQQGSVGWNNNNQGNSFSSPGNQRQQPFTQNQSTPVAQNSAKPVCDEKAFDEQFRLWEEQFENWKKENANHPDRTMYMQYEREFEKTRVRLLERREQMRRRKLMEQQQLMSKQPSQQTPEQQPPPQPLQTPNQNLTEPSQDESIPTADKNKVEEKQGDLSDMDQSEPEETDQVASVVEEELSEVAEKNAIADKNTSSDGNIFQNTQITGIFTSGGGIPGLDLVESKEDGQDRELPERDPPDVIDLEADGPSRPAKFPANTSTVSALLPPKPIQHPQMQQGQLQPDLGIRLLPPLAASQPQQKKIPSLFDIVVEKPILSPDAPMRNRSPETVPSPSASRSSKVDLTTDFGETRSRSISKDRDVLASPGQRPLSQSSSMSQRQSFLNNSDASVNNQCGNQSANLRPEAADLAKALQDPNVMQLLTVALAQAQEAGGLNPSNPQQQQLIQQLKQLQPLIQMQQQQHEQSFNNQQNQSWNNQQQHRQQSWKNQNSNFNAGGNMNQNRNSWGGNPFQRNNDQFSSNRGPGSGNESDGNNDGTQSRNPRNPFRSGGGGGGSSVGFGSDDNSGSNKNFGREFGGPVRNPFQDNDNCGSFNDGPNRNPFQGNDGGGPFGGNSGQGSSGGFGNQQQRGGNFGGGGRFNNNRNLSNFDTSLGFRNNQNPFGDCDNDYFRPTQVFDYQNRSRSDALVPPAKVVDYGHRPSAAMPMNSFNRDTSEFVPVKTIDYGHASNSAQKESTGPQRSRWNQDPPFDQAKTQPGRQSQISGQKVPQTQAPALEKKMNTESLPPNPQNKNNSAQLKNQNNKNQKQTQQQVKDPLNKQEKNAPQQEVKEKKEAAQQEETVDELDGENLSQYPNNKWILQNPESRQRPGPPTKRGKRNSGSRLLENNKEDTQINEGDEIEENFEEISDAEDLNESAEAPHQKSPFKAKARPLFPSVSDTIVNTPVVFPSMENNNTIPIDEILFKPGRLSRPKNIVIIIRGPPGSGKSHVAKLIKDKEVEMGGPTPRLLSIDDYFMVENDYEEKCPKTGRKIPKKEILYEYEKDMETTYMQYLIKSFKKTIADHLFEMIIVDCCNQSLRTFNEFYNAARDGNFTPFVVDLICDAETCLNQNIHNRKEAEIREIIKNYQDCPGHYIKLDVTNLLENVVEMEDVSDLEDNFVADSEVIELDDDDEPNDENDNDDDGGFLKSKWDTDPTTENLARLDGTSKPISKRGTATLEEYLQIDGWEPPTSNTNGKKRVRWADIEEKRAQDKMRAIGFVVGQTDWNRMMDPTSGSGALTKTKYIERVNKRR